jgi:hypothetical protein
MPTEDEIREKLREDELGEARDLRHRLGLPLTILLTLFCAALIAVPTITAISKEEFSLLEIISWAAGLGGIYVLWAPAEGASPPP